MRALWNLKLSTRNTELALDLWSWYKRAYVKRAVNLIASFRTSPTAFALFKTPLVPLSWKQIMDLDDVAKAVFLFQSQWMGAPAGVVGVSHDDSHYELSQKFTRVLTGDCKPGYRTDLSGGQTPGSSYGTPAPFFNDEGTPAIQHHETRGVCSASEGLLQTKEEWQEFYTEVLKEIRLTRDSSDLERGEKYLSRSLQQATRLFTLSERRNRDAAQEHEPLDIDSLDSTLQEYPETAAKEIKKELKKKIISPGEEELLELFLATQTDSFLRHADISRSLSSIGHSSHRVVLNAPQRVVLRNLCEGFLQRILAKNPDFTEDDQGASLQKMDPRTLFGKLISEYKPRHIFRRDIFLRVKNCGSLLEESDTQEETDLGELWNWQIGEHDMNVRCEFSEQRNECSIRITQMGLPILTPRSHKFSQPISTKIKCGNQKLSHIPPTERRDSGSLTFPQEMWEPLTSVQEMWTLMNTAAKPVKGFVVELPRNEDERQGLLTTVFTFTI